MNAYLNGLPLSETSSEQLLNRAFRYGDGLFETIISSQKDLYPYHFKRISAGAEALGLTIPESWDANLDFLGKYLPGTNNEEMIIRLYLYRQKGGWYTPTQTICDWLVYSEPYGQLPLTLINTCSICESVRLAWQPWSFAKTTSALPYVLAGREKQSRALDEVILLNHNGFVAEASASNLFWLVNGKWHTPSLKSACVAGTRRAQIIDLFAQAGLLVYEGLFTPDELGQAQTVFTSNVHGIRPLKYYNGRKLLTDTPRFLSNIIPLPEL